MAGEYQINVEYHLASGSFFEEAQKSITDNEIDLVVMGMGVKSFDQSLLGNTTTKAIHRFKPILVIPPDIEYVIIKKTLFAYDAHNDLNWPVLNILLISHTLY